MRRFTQLFLLSFVIIVVPTLLYFSHNSYDLVEYQNDSRIYNIIDKSQQQIGKLYHPPGQVSQGKGPAGAQKEGWYQKCLSNPSLSWKQVEKCMFGSRPPASASKEPSAVEEVKTTTNDDIKGNAIMPKLGNATAKAELGRATWKFLHTMTLRYPENPTQAEQQTMRDFFKLFSLLYPCGECANHFQQLLKDLPPQVGSRKSASLWLCSAHNRVNQRLGKPEFDCSHLDEQYDCGCGIDSIPASLGGNPLASALPKTMSSKHDAPKAYKREEDLEQLASLLARYP